MVVSQGFEIEICSCYCSCSCSCSERGSTWAEEGFCSLSSSVKARVIYQAVKWYSTERRRGGERKEVFFWGCFGGGEGG